MAIKQLKPTTPGQRGMTSQDLDEVTTKKPLKSLLISQKGAKGRNNQGRITTRHKGGGVKRHYRKINFNLPAGTTATVEEIEYDPNRSARIARIKDQKGNYHYIIAAQGLKKGAKITSDAEAPVSKANRIQLKNIPTGSTIYAIELHPGKGAQMVRSAGNGAQLVAKEGDYASVKLPSGEVRRVLLTCSAHIGNVSNVQHQNIKVGKAGRNRKKGIRPTVRGVVMNAADHPHGGGDGGRHNSGKAPRTPWGQKTLGYKTRSRKSSNSMIVKSRHQAKRRG